LRQIKAAPDLLRDKGPMKIPSHYAESFELPVARTPAFVRRVYRTARRLVRAIVARIDLSQFPGSCCG